MVNPPEILTQSSLPGLICLIVALPVSKQDAKKDVFCFSYVEHLFFICF
jgi:hypothetical protein